MAGAEASSPDDIHAAELELGVAFPEDYREWLLSVNGIEASFGEVFLMLYSLEDVVALTRASEPEERLPGYVAIGSDGGGESLALDFRQSQSPVVMVNMVCSGWHEGLPQAASFSDFMAQRDAGEPYRWEEGYR
ncbi:SMI1/KNR4 family protein [Nocardioides sp.]|uniref:SMI1/KNR4 family protein n=1 Tax=Nocardioides sp. TaxID=35761 RepID=UPI002B8AAF66|nr:SMI1/KNR4 family protein [Nocardioides sp.]HXH78916.1 SMI1/KNR4 family protein [Nocardioides sp.]